MPYRLVQAPHTVQPLVDPGASKTLIVAPPMTPNGDLHVGHISGPYLAADIYRRHLSQAGVSASYVLSSDDNQSYVDTSAMRLGMSPADLIAKSRAEVRSTLDAYAIDVNLFGQPDIAYVDRVQSWLGTLFRGGHLAVRAMPVLYDTMTRTYPVEAFVSGLCPSCLEPACGGICEACGHPNRCVDLVGLDPARYVTREEPRIVLDLEALRPVLADHLHAMSSHRSALRRLIDELLEAPLAPFVCSYPGARGVSAEPAGLVGQKLNVWAEMYVGHLHFLERAAGPLSSRDQYVQFLGFDNSFFYVIVHSALALASAQCGFDAPLPRAFLTNQFYFLSGAKFSTSKRHVIWARDLCHEYATDVIRLYLALHGPEFQEANFVPVSFAEAASGLVTRINRLIELFNRRYESGPASARALPDPIAAIAYGPPMPLERFSTAVLARRALNVLQYLADGLSAGDTTLLPYVPSLLARGMGPFCPGFVAEVTARYPMADHSTAERGPVALTQPLPLLSIRSTCSTSSA